MASAARLAALSELDRRLARELDRARAAGGRADAFRGLYIDEADVVRVLADDTRPLVRAIDEPRLCALREAFGLTELDVDILIAVLAPDLDPHYERVYAFLQDDMSKKRPAVGLLLRLLCAPPQEQNGVRQRFYADAPLMRHAILGYGEHVDGAPLLTAVPRADERIVAHLLGSDALDARLLDCARYEPAPQPAAFAQSAAAAVARAAMGETALLGLTGPRSFGKTDAARLFAQINGRGLLVVGVPALLAGAARASQAIGLVFREAQLRSSITYWSGVDALWAERADHAIAARALENAIAQSRLSVLLGSGTAWELPAVLGGRAVLRIEIGALSPAERREAWCAALADAPQLRGVTETVAAGFRLTARQIDHAVLLARAMARADADGSLKAHHLYAGARAVSGHGLSALGREVVPRADWSHLVLPDEASAQLRELCSTVRHRDSVLHDWGFDARLSGGKGVSALFAGSSGTGKTMAAEVIAGELGLALFRIDLAGIVSKWIGETEKNLDRVFAAAWDSNAILFFDEADALFGKRSEVKDSHDRYANLEISYLLQKMESYDGLAILATNMRQQLDDAFLRRLTFHIAFPLPQEEDRARIWAAVWPAELPRAADVDLARLARIKVTGGNIKNVLLAAAHLAAADRRPVAMDDLLHGLRREYQKLGKQIPLEELHASVGGLSDGASAQVTMTS